MKKSAVIVLIAVLLTITGCGVEYIKNNREHSLLNDIELIPNPMFDEMTVEEITKIIAQITMLISEKAYRREVEQTTLKKESTTSAKMADVVEIINQYRAESNLNQLKMSEPLCKIAEIRAKEASQKWSHTRPNGQKLDSLLENTEWRTAGENLARYRNATNTDIVDAWKNSESHRANLLDSCYKYCGISEYFEGKTHYISMIFTD